MGTSHLAISMANYLAGVKRKKVALLEWNDHNDFSALEKLIRADRKKKSRQTEGNQAGSAQRWNSGNMFQIMEVDYYKMADPAVLSFCLEQSYHYIIMDYGEATGSSLCECARCDKKVLVGSLSEWKAEAFLEALKRTGKRDKSWKLAVFSGSEDARREVETLFSCDLQRIPASVDAFCITHVEMSCFETLL